MSQIIHDKPPIFEEVSKLFGVTETDVIFYSYGDKIYSPTGKMPSDDLLIHEGTHEIQQEADPKGWWARYLIDSEWRVEQEAEAFGNQLRFLKGRITDRNALARAAHAMAASLSSPMYGKEISYVDAMAKIKAFSDGSVLNEIETLIPEADPD